MAVIGDLIEALARGQVEVIDLTQPLAERTPTLPLPSPFANTPRFSRRPLSRYDDDGPAWYWNAFETGEHTGTHLDAPIHWITGRDKDDVSQVPPARLVGPAVVVDKTAEAAADADFLLQIDDLEGWQREHGSFPDGSWLLYRTGWDARANDEAAFLNADETGPHTPGISIECARWIGEESPFIGVGVETVGIDAGAAHSFDPAFPVHSYLMGANKCGLTQLANMDKLPPAGAVVIAAPLKIEGGSGSPVRVFALVER
jgi:kynurenine formamidase